MRPVNDAESITLKNAWGGFNPVKRQRFEITAEDIGHTRPHYRGHNYSAYTFTHRDVGKQISCMNENNDGTSGWTCWVFAD
ncbi:hypothetical protein [Castellaniella sp.]|uniref:hypothetical protein n=1 Tax=Castellaniella sp. TaxID=1955812 RepID=UPI002AFE2962|nr:hypothetical protein [Castellaniella sp.]